MAGSALRLSLEYIGARFAMALIRHLPPRAVCAAACLAGDLAYLFARRRRRTALENIEKAGVAASPREVRRIARESFRSIALAVAESVIVPRIYEEGGGRQSMVDVVMPEATRKILEDPAQGVIIVSGHLGNWELGAKFTSKFKPVTGVARRMNNARVQELMDAVKLRDGFETIDKHDPSPMKVVRALRNHRALALLTDQHAHGESTCVIDFFGRPAKTYATPAVLHHLTHAPLVMCFVTRVGRLRFKAEYTAPFDCPIRKETLDADVAAVTQALASRLEDEIRKCPGQYLWAHRRWRMDK